MYTPDVLARLYASAAGSLHFGPRPPVSRRWSRTCAATLAAGLVPVLTPTVAAAQVTTIESANLHPWDVRDLNNTMEGAIADGGLDAYDDFGALHLRVIDGRGALLAEHQELSGFTLTHDGDRRWETLTPVIIADAGGSPLVTVSRALLAPLGTDYIRYVDTVANLSVQDLRVELVWGGNLGSDAGTTVSGTSSGDLIVDHGDQWVTTHQNPALDPAGPAGDPALAFVIGNRADVFTGPVSFSSDPVVPWPGAGHESLGFAFSLALAPGQTARLGTFAFRGRAENTDNPDGTTPTTGEGIAEAQAAALALASAPPFSDLTPGERLTLANWELLETLGAACAGPAQCLSGFCTDGVCCDAACGDGAVDCLGCSAAVGASTDGTCELLGAGVACRPAAGPCDAAELCDGAAVECPADGVAPAGAVCRPAVDVCDAAELCDGEAIECPPDLVAPAGVTCRLRLDLCDAVEVCDGTSPACPPDRIEPIGTVCRPATHPICDVAEACDGSAMACPPDATAPDGTSCADNAACDGDETCTAGACASGVGLDCDDGDPCTADLCAAAGGCLHDPIAGCHPDPLGCSVAKPGARARGPHAAGYLLGWAGLLAFACLVLRRR